MILLKWLRRLTIAFIVLILIVLFFIFTTPGLKGIFYVASKFIPGQLSYQQLDGDLMGPIKAKSITYKDSGNDIFIEDFSFNWSPGKLFHKKLLINSLLINKITIITPETKAEPKPKPESKLSEESVKQQVIGYLNKLKSIKLKPLSLPLSVKIDTLHIDSISFGHTKDKPTVVVQAINVNGSIAEQNMNLIATAQLIKPQQMLATVMLKGTVKDYTASVTLKNKSYDFLVNIKGNQGGALIAIPKAHALGGSMQGKLDLAWYPQVRWNINLDLVGIDPQLFDENLPKSITAKLNTQGVLKENDLVFNLDANIKAGQATLMLIARHDKIWDAKWNIDIPSIKAFYPKGQGGLKAKGYLHGKLKALQTEGTLSGTALHFNGIKLSNLKGAWQLYFDKPQESSVKITLDNFEYNKNKLGKINLDLRGNLLKHNVHAKLSVGKPALVFATHVHYDGANITGKITQFSFNVKSISGWSLKNPVKFGYSSQKAYLEPMCLDVSIGGSACIKVAWQQDQPWKFSLQSHNFNFKQLEKKFAPAISFDGALSINAHATGVGKDISNAVVKMIISPGMLTSKVDNNVINTAIRRSTLNLAINQKIGLSVNAALNFARRGQFGVKARIPDFTDYSVPFSDKKLQSTISIVVHDFSFVSIFENSLEVSNGTFAGKFSVKGTLGDPKIKGDGKLTIPSFVYKLVNVHAQNITAHLHVDGKKLTYHLVGYAFNGAPLYFSGDTLLSSPYALTHFYVHAKNAEAIKTAQMDAFVNTQLRFLLTHTQLDIVGHITVPKAQLGLVDFSSVTLMPVNQVTYTGLPKSVVPETSRIKTLDLKLALGNNVSFSGYGAHANLRGHLLLNILPTKGIVSNGQVRIDNGDFKAYGQDLEIADGSSVSFHNSQITNPYINAYAYKYVTTTMESTGIQLANNLLKVGLQIHGTISDMKFNLYSQPPGLSQANILSYMILGVAANNSNAASLSVFFNVAGGIARSSLTSTKPSELTGIKKFLNNTSIRMRNETVLDIVGNPAQYQTSLVVGNQLTDNFYVQYNQGIVVPESVFSLKYRLGRNWWIQSQAGSGYNVGVGADILYSIQMP